MFTDILKNSFFNRFLDNISSAVSAFIKKSRLSRIGFWLIKKIKQSFIAEWFLKPEKEIDVFESSKVVKESIETGSRIIEKGEKYSRSSAGRNIIENLKDEFLKRPVFVISIITLSAAATNTILWLLFNDFNLPGLILRVFIIAAALIGLNIKSDYGQSSLLINKIRNK